MESTNDYRAFLATAKRAETTRELFDILGTQKALITKVLDTWESIRIPEGKAAAETEVGRMVGKGVWDDPVEVDEIQEDAVICKLKLIISCKYWELVAKRKYKARIVAMGHLFWNKYMKIVRAMLQDWWRHGSWRPGPRLIAVVQRASTCSQRTSRSTWVARSPST